MNRKKKVVIGLVTAGALTAGAAAALWTANGTGSGTARSVTAVTITVNAAPGTADLYPGFTGGDVYFTLTNTNPYGVTFATMTPGTVTSSDPTGCPASNVTVSATTGLSVVVPAGATNLPQSISNVVTMILAAPDACQTAVFTIPMTLTGIQS